jgi:hypothetical protein
MKLANIKIRNYLIMKQIKLLLTAIKVTATDNTNTGAFHHHLENRPSRSFFQQSDDDVSKVTNMALMFLTRAKAIVRAVMIDLTTDFVFRKFKCVCLGLQLQ